MLASDAEQAREKAKQERIKREADEALERTSTLRQRVREVEDHFSQSRREARPQ